MSEEIEQHIKERFQVLQKIGSGAYGHVWKVKDKSTGQILALKKIFDAFQHSTDAQRTYREICYLHQFDHSNIIKLKELFRSDNDKDVYLVFEHMEVDLHRVIREGILKDKHKKYVVYQVARALQYLHSAQLVHRDLKPSNILVNQECHIKVCDFGLIRSTSNEAQMQDLIMTEYVATRWYRAPELLLGWTRYSTSIDIWSLGCVIAEIYKGKPLFPGSSTLDQVERVISWTGYPTPKDLHSLEGVSYQGILSAVKAPKSKPCIREEWFVSLEPKLKTLLTSMLQFNHSKRPTIQQVLSHPFLEQFHDPANEPVSQHPIYLDVDDSIKLSVKAYREKIWRFCKPPREPSPLPYRKSEDLVRCSKNNLKRKSIKSGLKEDNRSTDVSRTNYFHTNTHSHKGSGMSPQVFLKAAGTPSRHRRFTETETMSQKVAMSQDVSRVRHKTYKNAIEASLNGSTTVLKLQEFNPKRRSLSTVKNRRNFLNCNEFRRQPNV